MSKRTSQELADIEARLLNTADEEEAMKVLAEIAGGNPFEFVELALRIRADLKRQVKSALAQADKSRWDKEGSDSGRVPIEFPSVEQTDDFSQEAENEERDSDA